MLRTDSLEHVACLLTVKATACIRAKNMYPVFFGKDVAQFFELNRGLSLALFPQEMHTFPKHRHASLLSTRSFRRRDDQITQELQESSRIRQIIDHKRRERICGIQNDIPTLLNSRTDV